MIEFRKIEDPYNSEVYQLLINNVPLENVQVRGVPDENGKIYFDVSTWDADASRQIAAHSLDNFLPIQSLSLDYYLDHLSRFFESVGVRIYEAYTRQFIENPVNGEPTQKLLRSGTYRCSVIFEPNLSEWRGEYSFADYVVDIYRSFTGIDEPVEVTIDDSHGNFLNKKESYYEGGVDKRNDLDSDKIEKRRIASFSLTFPYSSPQGVIEDELKRFSRIFRPLHREVIDILTSKARNKSVSKFFDFPPEASVACEQYLLYFSQFLKDLGVEATADLKHDAGRLLFTVTPANADEALENIQAALSVYLALPANPISGPSMEDDIAVQKLSANIDHLKGQLRLSQAENRANEATIRTQQFHIHQMQRLLGGEVLLDSMKDVTPRAEKKDTEELISGILTLGEYEKGGMKLNLAKIYRALRQRFGKGQLPPKGNR